MSYYTVLHHIDPEHMHKLPDGSLSLHGHDPHSFDRDTLVRCATALGIAVEASHDRYDLIVLIGDALPF